VNTPENALSRLGRLIIIALLAACSDAPSSNPSAAADSGPETRTDTTSAAPPGVPAQPPIDRFKGPSPEIFDCTNPVVPSLRFSPHPIACVLDSECTERLVVGHRGAGGEFAEIAPENSLAAIRAALWMGVDGVELDIRHTADDQLVLMHDSTVDRTTTGSGLVSDMTLSEVTALPLKPENALGLIYGGDFSCELVPTLSQAFALTRDQVFIDLDTKTDRIDLVVAAIEDADLVDQVFISVGNAERAAQARSLNPDIRVQVRPDDEKELEAALALFPTRPPEIIEVPYMKISVLAPLVAPLDSALFSDAWEQDALIALANEEGSVYISVFDLGVKILQSEFPAMVLTALNRL
jgi:glycerophosphoryl diester phosphodiesterase